jgi:transcriptional regulator with XRE-family HTH domain
MSLEDFPKRLVEFCEAMGLQQQSLARAGGVSKSTFSNYAHGLKYPRMEILANWVARYGLNASWLLMGIGPMLIQDIPQDGRVEPSTFMLAAMNVASAQASLKPMSPEEVAEYTWALMRRFQQVHEADVAAQKPVADIGTAGSASDAVAGV